MQPQEPTPATTIIIPAYNEAHAIGQVLDEIQALGLSDLEVLVVSDGSTDGTAEAVKARPWACLLEHPYNIGNGAAVKTGIRAARGQHLLLMDGDGQHATADIPRLLAGLERFDMVVGARTSASETAAHRDWANWLYNSIAGYLAGRKVHDLTSGFRAIRAGAAKQFVGLLPNGFSYPSTITIALFRAGYTVDYQPIVTRARQGRSKIRLLRDGFGFLLILARIGTLFVPLKLFLPLAAALIALGVGYGAYLVIFFTRFTNMAALLILSGVMLFMLGLISEQIALLRLMHAERSVRESPER